MPIATLPTAPNRNMPPAEFSDVSDTWVAALALFTAQANALAVEVNTNATAAAASATAAATSATNSANSATAAASSATSASTSAGTATTQATAASGSATAAAGSATAAAGSATAAATARTGAETARTGAETARTGAEAAQTAAQGFRDQAEIFATQQLVASSTTSLTPGGGNKSFTIQTSRSFVTGMYLIATSTGAPANKMAGYVVSYNPATGALVVNVDGFEGSTARADWVIGVAAPGAIAGFATPYTPIATNTTAIPYGRYRLTATCNLTAPANPVDGSWFDVINATGLELSWIRRNAQNIGGLAEDMLMDGIMQAFRMTFIVGYGWTVTITN